MSRICSIQNSTYPCQFSTCPAQNTLALVNGQALVSLTRQWYQRYLGINDVTPLDVKHTTLHHILLYIVYGQQYIMDHCLGSGHETIIYTHETLYVSNILIHSSWHGVGINKLRPRQNGRHFTDDIFKCIFLNENVWITIKISMKFVPKGPINKIPALVQIMAWCRPGNKPLSEPMMVSLPIHICITLPQWFNEA